MSPGRRGDRRLRRATVEADRRGCCLVIVLGGEIDPVSAGDIEHVAVAGIRAGARHVHVDLSSVEFMDSSGLRALLAMARLVDSTSRVSLVSPTRLVRKLLEVTGLDAGFPVFETVAAAVAHAHHLEDRAEGPA